MSFSANYPTSAPSFMLDFANSNAVDPRVTFTRASTGSYFNYIGTLTTAAVNTPRLDYNPTTLAAQGLLIEEQRVNSFTQSGSVVGGVGAWSVVRSTSVASAATAPDGTSSGSKLQEDTTASNTHYVFASSVSYTSGTAYTQSIFVKADGRTQIQMAFPATAFTTELRILYNLTAVTATVQTGTPTGTITSVGNGWYRCTITATATATVTANTIAAYLAVAGAVTYTGDGTSGVFLWGAQLEAGAFPTSYIPTTTVAVTRSADVASVNTLTPWYNATEGTLYAEGLSFAPTSSFARVAAIEDVAFNAVISVQRNATDARGFGDGVSTIISASMLQNTIFKAALAAKVNDFALSANGSVPNTDTATNPLPTAVKMGIGQTTVGSSFINGYIRRIAYYPIRLSNANLQALTS